MLRDPNIGCQNNTAALDINNGAQPTAAGFSIDGGGTCPVEDAPGTGLFWPNPNPPNSLDGTALPGLPGGFGSVVRGISNLGAVSGFARTSAPQSHAAYWDTIAGPIVDLGSLLAPGEQSWGWRINNNAPTSGVTQVVGYTGTLGEGLLWECSGTCDLVANWSVTDLNDTDTIGLCSDEWIIRQAHDVNDNGWIIGMANAAPAERHAVLLAPLATCPPALCLGDIDGNGTVGNSDVLALLGDWGVCDPPPASCDADLDCDGVVGASDMLILLGEWGDCGFPIATGPPQDIQDCMTRFCCDPEDELPLIRCLELVTQ